MTVPLFVRQHDSTNSCSVGERALIPEGSRCTGLAPDAFLDIISSGRGQGSLGEYQLLVWNTHKSNIAHHHIPILLVRPLIGGA